MIHNVFVTLVSRLPKRIAIGGLAVALLHCTPASETGRGAEEIVNRGGEPGDRCASQSGTDAPCQAGLECLDIIGDAGGTCQRVGKDGEGCASQSGLDPRCATGLECLDIIGDAGGTCQVPRR